MARRFSAQHTKNGYAAMGGSLKRPRKKGFRNTTSSIGDAIARERAKAARIVAASKKK